MKLKRKTEKIKKIYRKIANKGVKRYQRREENRKK